MYFEFFMSDYTKQMQFIKPGVSILTFSLRQQTLKVKIVYSWKPD